MKYAVALFGMLTIGFASAPAGAVSITLGGNTIAGEGQVSALTGKNVFTENFNTCTKSNVNGIGNFNVVSGSQSGRYAAPTGDKSCYATIPEKNGSGTLDLTFGALRDSSKNTKDKYDYLGFYWGSVDQYNSVKFYDLNNVLVTTITGSQILALTHGEAGNQISDKSNVFVNLWFSPAEYIHRAEFISTGWAFELDNVSVRHAQSNSEVPEPGSLPLLATAFLVGPWIYRQRRRVRS